ncbi:MAG: hypothetical protein M8861_06270 [marine benthic group bacterium]|nr:hypothetical protein [Gemmatimonadota bacterium]
MLRFAALCLILALALPGAAFAQSNLEDGVHALFIGHSFFIPVAKSFDQKARESGFASHRSEMVFASGARGAPGSLWRDGEKREQIESRLQSGSVELLGMTSFGRIRSSYEDYQQWIDLALKHNPRASFFIGHSWTAGGPRIDTERFDQRIRETGEQLYQVVTRLRQEYAGTAIYFINYGVTASGMKARFEAGELEDIESLVGRDREALCVDGLMGHGGPMLTEVSALSWLSILYGVDVEDLDSGPYSASDVQEIVAEVVAYNRSFDGDYPER